MFTEKTVVKDYIVYVEMEPFRFKGDYIKTGDYGLKIYREREVIAMFKTWDFWQIGGAHENK